MKITVFGATGRTGRAVVEVAARRGHHVTAVARDVTRARGLEQHAEIVVAQVRTDPDAVAAATCGRDAVIVTLGPRSPFERFVVTDAIANIVPAMEHTSAQRLVVLSALGLSPAIHPAPPLLRLAAVTLMRNPAADKRTSEEIIQASGLDWILVLPGPLTSGRSRGVLQPVSTLTEAPTRIARVDLAELLVTLADSSDHARAVTVNYLERRPRKGRTTSEPSSR
jgi:uncharacterized protein YbjT (DUF2867 family)